MLPPGTPNEDLFFMAYTPSAPRHGPIADPDLASLRARAIKRDPKPRITLSGSIPTSDPKRYVTPTHTYIPSMASPGRSSAITSSPYYNNHANQVAKLDVNVVPLTPHKTPTQRKSKPLPHPTGSRFLCPDESPRMICDLSTREIAALSPEGLGPSLVVPPPTNNATKLDLGKNSTLNFLSSPRTQSTIASSPQPHSLDSTSASISSLSPLNWSERSVKSFEIFQDSPESQNRQMVDALKSPVRLGGSSPSSAISSSPVLGPKSVNSPRAHRQPPLRVGGGMTFPPPPPLVLHERSRQQQIVPMPMPMSVPVQATVPVAVTNPSVEESSDLPTTPGMWFSFRGKRVFRPFVNGSGSSGSDDSNDRSSNSGSSGSNNVTMPSTTIAVSGTITPVTAMGITPTDATLVPPRRLFGAQSSGPLSLSVALGSTTLSNESRPAHDPFISPNGPVLSQTSSPSPPALSRLSHGSRLLTPPTSSHLQAQGLERVVTRASNTAVGATGSNLRPPNPRSLNRVSPPKTMGTEKATKTSAKTSTAKTPTRTPTRGSDGSSSYQSKATPTKTPTRASQVEMDHQLSTSMSSVPLSTPQKRPSPPQLPPRQSSSMAKLLASSSSSSSSSPSSFRESLGRSSITPIQCTHVDDNKLGDDNKLDKRLAVSSTTSKSKAPALSRPIIRPLLSPLVLTSSSESPSSSKPTLKKSGRTFR